MARKKNKFRGKKRDQKREMKRERVEMTGKTGNNTCRRVNFREEKTPQGSIRNAAQERERLI